jgi:circadian clock protein KaiB
MISHDNRSARNRPDAVLAEPDPESYALTLFISGASSSSARAIAKVGELCDQELDGRHQLSIVDLNQEPALAAEHHVLATPTLIKHQPLPIRTVVGDMSDHSRILLALGIDGRHEPAGHADDTNRQADA